MASAAANERYKWAEVFLKNALYGCFAVLYTISSFLLIERRRHYRRLGMPGHVGYDTAERQRLRTMRFWEITGATMFALVTCDWAIDWVLFIGDPPDQVANNLGFVRILLSQLVILLGDLVIIHRVWVIGTKNKRLVAFPMFALTAFIAFGIPFSWQYYLVLHREPLPHWLRRNFWIICIISSTLGVNIYCSLMLTWKIWWTNRDVRRHIQGQVTHVLVILVESAGIYSAWMFVVLVLVAKENSLYFYFYDIATELYAVVTMAISVRVGLGWAVGGGGRTNSRQKLSDEGHRWEPMVVPASPGLLRGSLMNEHERLVGTYQDEPS